jgi:hypothetical protein
LKSIPGLTATNWGIYGGNAASDCGLNNVNPGGNVYAVALVITILAPNFDAYIGVGDINDLNTILATVAVNFTHGQGISTMYIVPQLPNNNIRFAMPAGLSANVIFDVVGYFARSQATALDCVNSAITTVNVANAATFNFVIAGACPATYTETGLNCHAALSFGGTSWTGFGQRGNQNGDCQGVNNSGSAQNYDGFRTCCRVPGR